MSNLEALEEVSDSGSDIEWDPDPNGPVLGRRLLVLQSGFDDSVKRYLCIYCYDSFNEIFDLSDHQEHCQGVDAPPQVNPDKIYKKPVRLCTTCDQTFDNQSLLLEHQKICLAGGKLTHFHKPPWAIKALRKVILESSHKKMSACDVVEVLGKEHPFFAREKNVRRLFRQCKEFTTKSSKGQRNQYFSVAPGYELDKDELEEVEKERNQGRIKAMRNAILQTRKKKMTVNEIVAAVGKEHPYLASSGGNNARRLLQESKVFITESVKGGRNQYFSVAPGFDLVGKDVIAVPSYSVVGPTKVFVQEGVKKEYIQVTPDKQIPQPSSSTAQASKGTIVKVVRTSLGSTKCNFCQQALPYGKMVEHLKECSKKKDEMSKRVVIQNTASYTSFTGTGFKKFVVKRAVPSNQPIADVKKETEGEVVALSSDEEEQGKSNPQGENQPGTSGHDARVEDSNYSGLDSSDDETSGKDRQSSKKKRRRSQSHESTLDCNDQFTDKKNEEKSLAEDGQSVQNASGEKQSKFRKILPKPGPMPITRIVKTATGSVYKLVPALPGTSQPRILRKPQGTGAQSSNDDKTLAHQLCEHCHKVVPQGTMYKHMSSCEAMKSYFKKNTAGPATGDKSSPAVVYKVGKWHQKIAENLPRKTAEEPDPLEDLEDPLG